MSSTSQTSLHNQEGPAPASVLDAPTEGNRSFRLLTSSNSHAFHPRQIYMIMSRYLHTSKSEVHRLTYSLHVRISVTVLKTHGYRTYDICEYDADEVHLANPSMSICGLFESQTTPPSRFLSSPTTRRYPLNQDPRPESTPFAIVYHHFHTYPTNFSCARHFRTSYTTIRRSGHPRPGLLGST
jgi:hypothetical protein